MMKYLVIILIFFSIHSYSAGIKEKVLICIDEEKYINKDITKSDYIFGYIFNNQSANYYYNVVMNNGMYDIDNILNIKYNVNENFIVIPKHTFDLTDKQQTLPRNEVPCSIFKSSEL